MEWSLEDFPGVDDIVEYECRLNDVTSRFEDVVVCTYELSRFSATVVMDILRTHPQVIVGGILQENPFYAPPEQFLQELRRATSPSNEEGARRRRLAMPAIEAIGDTPEELRRSLAISWRSRCCPRPGASRMPARSP